jgi:AcrR family transcriptional regulator
VNQQVLPSLKIEVNSLIYLKDPASSELGKKILSSSLLMIDEMGMECFTFRKLAKLLNTTESSIYRYFESKHKLLLYFYNWYWAWMEYKIIFSINNIVNPTDKLKIAIGTLCSPAQENNQQFYLPLNILNKIVISESSKAYFSKEVDEENKSGFFLSFKRVASIFVGIIGEIDKNYPFAHTLVATCLEGILHQQYFSEHLPSLSDFDGDNAKLEKIFYEIIINNMNQIK